MKMRLHPEPFERIKSGKKKVECRLYDEKRRRLEVGDVIEFESRETGDIVEKEVGALHVFPTFEEMFVKYPEERINNVYQYYTPEEEREMGVMVIEFK